MIHQFGRQIKQTVTETLQRLDVTNARVTVVDKGALRLHVKGAGGVRCVPLRRTADRKSSVGRCNPMTQSK